MQSRKVLRYIMSATHVGLVLVLMSHEGVVDIVLDGEGVLGDLYESLRSRFPNTRLIPDDGAHSTWAAAVVARIDGASTDFAVPIDLAWSSAPVYSEMAAPARYERAS